MLRQHHKGEQYSVDWWIMRKTTGRIEHWQTVLEEKWGITANLSALDGEYDLNFLAKVMMAMAMF
jgi:hypothetical protein|tara:strand:+ start:336 stop:530 length:195 start_codon:yes stop_codon:yes gene_type:complete